MTPINQCCRCKQPFTSISSGSPNETAAALVCDACLKALSEPKTCPCKLAVPLDYSNYDPDQVKFTQLLIKELGEFTTVHTLDGKHYKVSRHCIALHGIKARDMDTYGLEQVNP